MKGSKTNSQGLKNLKESEVFQDHLGSAMRKAKEKAARLDDLFSKAHKLNTLSSS